MGKVGRPQLVELAAAEHGGVVVSCNDMFFGSRHNLIMPGRGVNMGDGWETRRSRREGPDWVVVRLATEGAIERAIVDTLHFAGDPVATRVGDDLEQRILNGDFLAIRREGMPTTYRVQQGGGTLETQVPPYP